MDKEKIAAAVVAHAARPFFHNDEEHLYAIYKGLQKISDPTDYADEQVVDVDENLSVEVTVVDEHRFKEIEQVLELIEVEVAKNNALLASVGDWDIAGYLDMVGRKGKIKPQVYSTAPTA